MKKPRKQSSQRNAHSSASHLIEEALGYAKVFGLRRTAFASREYEAVTTAVSDFASNLKDFPWIQSQIESLADGMGDVAAYMQETDAEEMMHDAVQFARERPYVTFAVALAGGAVAARLLWSDETGAGQHRTSNGRQRKRGRSSARGRGGVHESRANA